MNSIGRSSFSSLTFYIMGDEDAEREACGITTNKSLFSEGVPVINGLYDPHYGSIDLSFPCATCYSNKMLCPGHDGIMPVNYVLQSPLFRKELLKWLRITCFACGEFVIKREAAVAGLPAIHKLGEFVKLARSGTEKFRKCAHCDTPHPWISRDAQRHGIIWREMFTKGNKQKSEVKEYLYNHEIRSILARIPDSNVLKMGKTLICHPKKIMLSKPKVSTTVIRPEIRKIGGNRSTMADITAHLRTMVELNTAIPKELPKEIDNDLHAKLVMIDLSFFEMILGSSASATGGLKLMPTTNKVSNSLAARLPKKHGRLRLNLMGRRTTKMARSVITGDKALRLEQVGVPKMIAKGLFIPETVCEWNHARLTTYFLNGTKRYPGCSKIKRKDTGQDYYVNTNYTLQIGDVVYRNLCDKIDTVSLNREPSLLYCSITALTVKIIPGYTIRLNSSICNLFNRI